MDQSTAMQFDQNLLFDEKSDSLLPYALELEGTSANDDWTAEWKYLSDTSSSGSSTHASPSSPPSILQYDPQLSSTLQNQPLVHTSLPDRSKKADRTKQFSKKFQALIQRSNKAAGHWRKFKREHKTQCSVKRCIRLKLAFCEKFGDEFRALCDETCYSGLGSRTTCTCTDTLQVGNEIVWHTVNPANQSTH